MSDDARELTPLGQLLERARKEVLGITGREAARRSGVSDARWRQVVSGYQSTPGGRVKVNPSARSVVRMAIGVGVEPAAALEAAGIETNPEQLRNLAAEAKRALAAGAEPPAEFDLDAALEQIERLDVSPAKKLAAVERIMRMYEQAQAERRAGPSARPA